MAATRVVYLSIGGNMGNPYETLVRAKEMLSSLPDVWDFRSSGTYETTPLSDIPQPFFMNAVCCFKTSMEPRQCLLKIQGIERALGKVPKPKNAPRPIDIDILFYGDLCFKDAVLEIPHPLWDQRLFVLAPLAELVNELLVPTKEGDCKKVQIRPLLQNYQTCKGERATPIQMEVKNGKRPD